MFLADFSFVFCDQKKNPPQNSPPNPPLRGEFLFQKSPGLEAPEIHRPPPPRESKSKSCAFGSGTVTFQGGSFQQKTPGLIGPRNLRILIGRIAVGWPCMECHVPCHIRICWVWDSVKQSEGWGKNPALIARSPTRHSKLFIEKFHHKSSLLVWLPKRLRASNYRSHVATFQFADSLLCGSNVNACLLWIARLEFETPILSSQVRPFCSVNRVFNSHHSDFKISRNEA